MAPPTAHRRPQLSVDELHQLKWLLGGVLTLLAVGTVFYMDVEAWTLMILTAVATLTMLARPTWPARLPPIAHTLAFPAIVAFFIGDLWLRAEVLPAMVRLDMLLLLYRTLTYRARRDDLQVIVLGLFLVVVAGVLTVSLVFAAQILIYTACALAFLLAITLSDGVGASGAGAKSPAPNVPPAWAVHANWGQLFRRLREVADWRVVTLGSLLFVGVLGVSALLFLAIPRFQLENSMFLDRFISKKSKSGFSDTIRFGDVTDIQQDTSVALSVDLTDRAQVPSSPYWRMLILDDYREGTFRLSPALRNAGFGGGERTGQRIVGEARPRRGEPVYWTFYLESGVSRYLPLLGQFEALQFVEAQNYRRASALNLIALRNEPVTMTAYRVEGLLTSGGLPDPDFATLWTTRRRDPAVRRHLFLSSALDEVDRGRLSQVLNDIQIGPTSPPARGTDARSQPGGTTQSASESAEPVPVTAAQFAERVGGWLRANHGYTLSPRIPGTAGDPLVRWLLSREAGHCELFAGSFVLLARTAGFPARVVTGFKGGSWNAFSNNFTIRNSDAHAWAEIFDAATGTWMRADPLETAGAAQTDETRGEAALARRLDRSWSARFDSLRVFWYRRIVSFDQRSQVETLKKVKDATQNSGRRIREALENVVATVKAWLTTPWDARRVAQVGAVGMALAAAIWLWRNLGRGWWRRVTAPRGGTRDDPVRREAGRWLRLLQEAEGQSATAATKIADLQRLRFGARESWPNPEHVFRQARHELRDARRARRATRAG